MDILLIPPFAAGVSIETFFFNSSDLFPALQWHRESRPLLSAGIRYNRMLHGIFCAPVIGWGLEVTPRYICSLVSMHSVKTPSPRRLKKLLFHRALEGIWEQFFILASEICAFSFIFHCYYSSRPLKLNWKRTEANIATNQFCIGSGGAENLTDLFHQYFLQFSWRK